MINILDVDAFLKKVRAKGPVNTSLIYISRGQTYHPSGLFSEEFFGIAGSDEQRKNFSWIELNCWVIHPFLYYLFKNRIEKRIESLVSMKQRFRLDEKTGQLIPDSEGDIFGLSKLYEVRKKWRFGSEEKKMLKEDEEPVEELSEDESDESTQSEEAKEEEEIFQINRDKILAKLEEYRKKDLIFMNKLIVIPPAYRPISIDEEKNTIMEDPLNDIYKRIISLSEQVSKVSGHLKDLFAYRIQLALEELYEYVKMKLSKKTGIIRDLMLGRRVDFSARAVITPNPNLNLGEVGIPLRIICQIFEPHMLYGLTNSSYAKNIPQSFHDKVLEFLGKEAVIAALTRLYQMKTRGELDLTGEEE